MAAERHRTCQVARTRHYDALWRGAVGLVGGDEDRRELLVLMDAALGLEVTRQSYEPALAANGVAASGRSAARDLARLTQVGLLVSHGDNRGRRYTPGLVLERLRAGVIQARPAAPASDPFA
ncbi:MAG: hypothetical protein LBG11_06575 [Bifidobacteriaceae bacterium]|nr:hypothetical protein [Bifidobacteriaceae bacterium]